MDGALVEEGKRHQRCDGSASFRIFSPRGRKVPVGSTKDQRFLVYSLTNNIFLIVNKGILPFMVLSLIP